MKKMTLPALTLFFVAAAQADFSYTTTAKATGGAMASVMGGAGPQTSKYYLKGRKIKTDNGAVSTIIDFDAQTVTTIRTAQKTYSVKGFDELAAGSKSADVEATVDVKETGQKKNVNGFNANEVVMTMEVESEQSRQMGKMQVEVDTWLSPDVPGYEEWHAFYQRNMAKFPWAAMGAGAGPSMQKAMADIQRKMASMHGVQVQSIVRMKAPGAMAGSAAAGPSPAQTAQMQQSSAKACAQLQAMMAQGGPLAAAVKPQYDRMCGGAGGAPTVAPGSSNALIEMTVDSSDFSTSGIADSVFAIPADYQKSN